MGVVVLKWGRGGENASHFIAAAMFAFYLLRSGGWRYLSCFILKYDGATPSCSTQQVDWTKKKKKLL